MSNIESKEKEMARRSLLVNREIQKRKNRPNAVLHNA